MFVSMVVLLIALITNILIFRKAGYNGWEAIIPIYNSVCLFNIVGLPGWLIIFAFIPFVNFAFVFLSMYVRYKLAKCFGKSNGFAVLSLFFGTICACIIAFDKNCDYQGVV